MIHHGFKYQRGLNIDTVPFNPTGSCLPGGLYFSDKENIVNYLGHGKLIAYLELPEDARIYKDPDGNKWKADKIIIKDIKNIEDFEGWTEYEFCVAVVENDVKALQYVKEQADKICR
jgi:hypothetical protein